MAECATEVADLNGGAGPDDGAEAGAAEVHGLSATFSDRTGVVIGFDEHVGSGTVADNGTGQEWWFHCTRIADGTRAVPVGVPVRFRIDVGPTGFEAVDITVRTNS